VSVFSGSGPLSDAVQFATTFYGLCWLSLES
jgi:hypothetical protein